MKKSKILFAFFSVVILLFSIMQITTIHTAKVTAPSVFYEVADATFDIENTGNLTDYTPDSYDINNIHDINGLMQHIYAVDKKTIMTPDLFDIPSLLNEDCKIHSGMDKPRILIFHTHANELYADSTGKENGVWGSGEYLKEILEQKYGISVLHIGNDFDMVNGKLQRNGAYERVEPYIRQILMKNPSIELVIDLHRDGVGENVRLVKNIDGKKYAKIMFFNGLCQKNENGKAVGVGLENPYLKQNLALSLKMQLALDKTYPGVSRKIYLNAYRYSLHMMDKSLLIELGAQTNTVEEIHNSIEILAEVLADVVVQKN